MVEHAGLRDKVFVEIGSVKVCLLRSQGGLDAVVLSQHAQQT